MSGRPSRKSAEISLFHPFSAFFALFRRVQRAPGKPRKRRKKAFFLRYPQICLSPHLLNPHLRHSKSTKIRVKSECAFGPLFLPPFFHFFPPLFPFRPWACLHHFSPLHLPLHPPFLAPGKVRFRYPSDLGTL